MNHIFYGLHKKIKSQAQVLNPKQTQIIKIPISKQPSP